MSNWKLHETSREAAAEERAWIEEMTSDLRKELGCGSCEFVTYDGATLTLTIVHSNRRAILELPLAGVPKLTVRYSQAL